MNNSLEYNQNFNTYNNTTSSNEYCTYDINTNSSVNNAQKQIKYEQQKEKLKSLKRQIEGASSQNEINDIKGSIYGDLTSINASIITLTEQNKYLQKENAELKMALDKKNNLIEQFQEVARISNEKFMRMSDINDGLKKELENAYKTIRMNVNIKRENIELLSSLSEIKEQLNAIENNYNQKIYNNQNEIKALNIQIRQLEDKNAYLSQNCNTITLKVQNEIDMLNAQINCLKKEKEILMKEKEKDHNEIITYRKEYSQCSRNMCRCKEQEYIKEINKLHGVIADREKEVDYIKDQLLNSIHDLKLENEKLQYHLELILNSRQFKMRNRC